MLFLGIRLDRAAWRANGGGDRWTPGVWLFHAERFLADASHTIRGETRLPGRRSSEGLAGTHAGNIQLNNIQLNNIQLNNIQLNKPPCIRY